MLAVALDLDVEAGRITALGWQKDNLSGTAYPVFPTRGRQAEASALQALSIGFFHMDLAEVKTAEGKLYLFVGIDRTSEFAVMQLVDKADRRTAWEFLERLLEVVPYRIHTILTDNGIQFADQPRNRTTPWSRSNSRSEICAMRTDGGQIARAPY